ncbi:MAG: hypothetical protein KA004_13860 [Verrucomicrobiales bacterium]|nr:hypothetical protein [Verrucomicrobiales bacterium]
MAAETGMLMSDLNDTARYLAGMQGGANSQLGEFRRTDHWRLHQANMNELWHRFSSSRMPRIEAFSRSELGGYRDAKTVFYPFGGPDFLFVHAFFPGAQNYVLGGLEGSEMVPPPQSLTAQQREAGLDGIYTSLTTALNCSFFITKDMRVDLQRTQYRGTLPLVLAFMARLGMDIEAVAPVSLTPAGILEAGLANAGCPGYRVRCRSGFGPTHQVYYFQENLADGNLARDARMLQFTRSLGPSVTYLKSASYLMHTGEFSLIRRHILENSLAILEDDSGIPFRYFKPGQWSVLHYGNYSGVLDIFSEYYQPDLAAVYHSGGPEVQTIDFGIGYKFEAGQSALLWARRL